MNRKNYENILKGIDVFEEILNSHFRWEYSDKTKAELILNDYTELFFKHAVDSDEYFSRILNIVLKNCDNISSATIDDIEDAEIAYLRFLIRWKMEHQYDDSFICVNDESYIKLYQNDDKNYIEGLFFVKNNL